MTGAPHSAVAEAFRFAAGSVERMRTSRGLQALAFVSPLASSGKSTVVANLALAIAEGGTRVLVVDGGAADGDTPPVGGFEELLAGQRALADYVQPSPFNSAVAILGSGPPGPSRVTGAARSRAIHVLLAEAKHSFDVVLIDTPAFLQVADATELVEASDAAIIVLSPSELIRDHLEMAERLKLIGSHVVGYIYNRAPTRHHLAPYRRNDSLARPTSGRLRRRDDIARALGAPVRLSVGRVRLSRWWPSRRGLEAANSTNVRRIVAYLGSVLPARSQGVTALAVIPVDDPQVAALSLVSLARSYAERGVRVVVADLASGAPAGRLLGVQKPGIDVVILNGARFVIAIPEPDDVAPVGPLDRRSPRSRGSLGEAIATAWADTDLLLTLSPLDPALGGEHLATWAANAVAVITAGRSSWTRIHAVSQMAHFAGTRLDSAVVVGADETDESLGMPYPPEDGQDADAAGGGQDGETTGGGQYAGAAGNGRPPADTQGFLVTADRGPGPKQQGRAGQGRGGRTGHGQSEDEGGELAGRSHPGTSGVGGQ